MNAMLTKNFVEQTNRMWTNFATYMYGRMHHDMYVIDDAASYCKVYFKTLAQPHTGKVLYV